jgi:hypothetical protein
VDKAARRAAAEAYRAQQREARITLCPISEPELDALVTSLEHHVASHGCDHSTAGAERWATARSLDFEDLRAGLAELGGYCDCEIVDNCDPGVVFGR